MKFGTLVEIYLWPHLAVKGLRQTIFPYSLQVELPFVYLKKEEKRKLRLSRQAFEVTAA